MLFVTSTAYNDQKSNYAPFLFVHLTFTLGNIEIPCSFSVTSLPRCIKCSCRERGVCVCGTSLSAKSFLKVIPTPLRLFDQTKRDVISIQRLKCLSLSWFVTVDLSSNDSSWAILYFSFSSKMKPRQVKAGPGGQVWWATFNSFLFSAHTLTESGIKVKVISE